MAGIKNQLGMAITGREAGRITDEQLNKVFQDAIDNGDILLDENHSYVVSTILPLVGRGALRSSDYLVEFERQVASDEHSVESLEDVNLEQLEQQFRGAPYSRLVQHHLRRLDKKLEGALTACVQAFSGKEGQVAERLVDEYNGEGSEADFWSRDSADLFLEICQRFSDGMESHGIAATDSAKSNMFQVITMSFALMARDQKAFRRFAGIKKGLFFR